MMRWRGQFEEFVVCRITTRSDPLDDRDHLGPSQQFRQVIAIRRAGHRRNVRPRKDVQNLLLGYGGLEQAAVLINPANDEEG